jgi:DNA-binding LytR/AlgR family response regulator
LTDSARHFFKAEELLLLKQAARIKDEPEFHRKSSFFFIKSNKKTYKINFSEICYIEGLGDYIQVHLENQKIVTNLSMKRILEILPGSCFTAFTNHT